MTWRSHADLMRRRGEELLVESKVKYKKFNWNRTGCCSHVHAGDVVVAMLYRCARI
jgi:hypothetical protein